MGFFDRFTSKKPASSPAQNAPAQPAAGSPAAETGGAETKPNPVPAPVSAKARLDAAREKLELKDLAGALAIYEELLAGAGDRADVLVTISGDLGTHGHVAEIVELVAPRYDAERHGPATGLNLLQAYLAMRNADAAQHVLDILFSLNRPELEERLHGFSNAIAELMVAPDVPAETGAGPGRQEPPKIGLVSISKPIWFYGLEPLAAEILPAKAAKVRRIAFAQLATPGHAEGADAKKQPEDELGRLSRAIPLWLAETFSYSPIYAPIAAIAIMTPPDGPSHHVAFGAEWTTDNLRQLVESASEGVDYIVTGAIKVTAGDYALVLRIWEVKGIRERKMFRVNWTPATVDAALTQMHAYVRGYMEWSAAPGPIAYAAPAQPRTWLETLGASLGLFTAEKNVLPRELLRPVASELAHAAQHAAAGETASLAYLTLAARARALGLAEPVGNVALNGAPVVTRAREQLGL